MCRVKRARLEKGIVLSSLLMLVSSSVASLKGSWGPVSNIFGGPFLGAFFFNNVGSASLRYGDSYATVIKPQFLSRGIYSHIKKRRGLDGPINGAKPLNKRRCIYLALQSIRVLLFAFGSHLRSEKCCRFSITNFSVTTRSVH